MELDHCSDLARQECKRITSRFHFAVSAKTKYQLVHRPEEATIDLDI